MKFTFTILSIIFGFAVLTQALPSDSEDTAPETSFLDAEFEQTKKQVHSLLQTGKSDAACRDLSKATSDEVTANVKAQQNTLNGMSRGQDCDKAGQGLIDNAKKNLNKEISHAETKKRESNAAKKKKINFGDFAYDQLTEGQCGSFFNQKVWRDAKANVAAAQKAHNNAQAAVKSAQDALTAAKNEAARRVKECRCKAKKALEKALETMNNGARAANTKAWTKAQHLLCVLDGKTTNNCPVSAIPTVKMVKLSKKVKQACKIEAEWVANAKSGGSVNAGKSFKLYKMKKIGAFGNNDVNKYADYCYKEGLLPVGCGDSHDCSGKWAGGGKCVSMPASWGCNMMNKLAHHTGFGNDIMAFCSNGMTGCGKNLNLYTVGGYAGSSGKTLHPVCGKWT
jgi:hypothetical protein